MCKRIFIFAISIIVFMSSMLLPVPLHAVAAVGDTGTYNGFQYKVITDSTAMITKYTQNETVVTVPETINGYTVTQIGNAAFQDQNLVQRIILPETITRINDVNVFWYCRSLRSINLPEGLTHLSAGAFTMCTSLEEIVIPDGITTLSKTFRGCSSLRRVVIPDSVTSIDQYTFADSISGTNLLTNVTIYCHEGSYAETFATQNGINCVATAAEIELNYVQNSDGADTVTVTGVKNHALISGDFILPETIDGHTVTQIGPEAFKEQSAMTSFVMPDTVTSISYSVFWDCANLQSVHLSDNLTGTLAGTFGYCRNLESVNIPDGVTVLRKTFISCAKLANITLPSGLTRIETEAFRSCVGLESVYLPESVSFIADDAFVYCTNAGITAYVDSMDSYAAGAAGDLGMIVKIIADTPFSIESREIIISNGKPIIHLNLKNNYYVGECTAYAVLYNSNASLYDVSVQNLSNSTGAQNYDLAFPFTKDFADDLTYKIIVFGNHMEPLLNVGGRVLTDFKEGVANYPTMNLFESNSASSSWDRALGLENFSTTGWTNLALWDTSALLPYEAYRSFPAITDRTVTLDFDFSMNRMMDDTRFSIMNDRDIIVGFVTQNRYLYYEQANGTRQRLSSFQINSSYEVPKCYVRVEFDLKSGMVNYIRVNGNIVATGLPLTHTSNVVNGFDITTGESSTGILVNRQVRINCDYLVNEDFTNQSGTLPRDGWNYVLSGSQTGVYEINSRVPDRFSIDVDTTEGSFQATKSFNPASGNPVFEIMTLQPQKRDGLSFALKNGNQSVLEISTDGEDFILTAGNYTGKFYKYQANVWYGLKAEVDLINSRVNIFVNNKKVLSNIRIDVRHETIDSIEITASEDSAHLVYDDVKLYQKRVLPNDYVSVPSKPQKSSNDFVLGMQVCNLWTEGQYNKTWDYIKSAPNRLPSFGPYDEGNPEMNDWEIKWLLEHGIDFEWIWAYPNIKYSASNGGSQTIKPNVVREGHYIYDGLMNAEYSDMMKFAISFENDTVNSGTAFYNEFFETYVPYWIEYYFKDSRYMKIDGRPIVGIYNMDKFLSIFGTMGQDDAAINQGIARFRQMCIDAGVGDPYIISHGFGYTEATFQKYAPYDIDCIGIASWPKHEGVTWQKSDIRNMARLSGTYNMDFVTSLQPKVDLSAWEGETGFYSSGEEFTSLLTWVKNELPSQITHRSLSKNIINIMTWNEFGEGHILMPHRENGFTYLDCIRSVFVGSGSHTDTVPTGEQVNRINRMVDNDRLVTKVRENPIPRTPENPSGLTVRKGWYFSSATDYADWTAESSASISRQNNKMVVTAVNNEPVISLTNVPAVNLFDVTYVKVRMKGNTTSCGGNIKWTTQQEPAFDTSKQAYLETPDSTAGTMQDYYIPIGRSVKRNGKLTGLKLTPGRVLDKSQKFEIESIELLADPMITNGTKIVYGNVTVSIGHDPVSQNGTLMLPLREVAETAGGTVNWYAHNNSYIVYRTGSENAGVVFEIGSLTASKNGTSFALDEAPYSVSNKINDTVYVPASLIEQALNIQIAWDATGKTLTISDN